MQALLQFILEGIVDNPKDIIINTSEDQYGFTTYDVSINPNDMGKIIGKNGKTISAIRKILKIRSMKTGKKFQLNLIDLPQTD